MSSSEDFDELFEQLYEVAANDGLEAAASKMRADGVPDEIVDQLVEHYKRYEQFCDDADAYTPAQAAARLRRYGLEDKIVEALVERYERHVGVVKQVRSPSYMQSGGRMTWYTGPRPNDPCWPRLVSLLEGSPAFDDDGIRELDDTTTRIVSLLEHPATLEFKTRGLVLGHVQAGKTTNYTGVVAKAVDRGYRLVIVLAGIHNELRRQTQDRLIAHLVRSNPELWVQLTDPDQDFRPTANAPAYFGTYARQAVLCVVKKNAVVLRKLIAWLSEASQQLESIPALVIDDEADQAGVATKTINPLIRSLLDVLPRVGYVGYTATPFANLLIDPSSDDLYPKHFIVDLPQPPDHFGTESIFGREPLDGEDPADYDDGVLDMVRVVPDEEVSFVRPATSHDVDTFVADVRGQLRRSILYFWLATAARRVRGTGVPHSTMLIHTSVRVAVHESFRKPIVKLQEDAAARLVSQDKQLVSELRTLWEEEIQRVPAADMGEAPVEFGALLKHLPDVLRESRVILDNSRSDERLDYSGERIIAIAVGGNTLSRGLTLEGLIVSYYVRAASAYDTLLQMGRWFGYRAGYADLPRIWMTEELYGWFRHIAGVEAEIRQDIDRYMHDDVTPETFAVRIQAHPTLTITAAAKMQSAVLAAASFGGLRIQTRYFRANDEKWLRENQEAARALITELGGVQSGDEDKAISGYIWRDAPSEVVLAFLNKFQVHEREPDNDARLIARYVRNRNDRGRLERWNVALIGSSTANQGGFDFGSGVEVPRVIRARVKDSPSDAAYIKTLMSRRDAAVDIEVPDGTEITETEIVRLRQDQAPDTPLLTIYAIDPTSPTTRKLREPLDAVTDAIGIGIVFPKPPPGDEDKVYWQADLSGVAESRDDYLEEDDLTALEEEQV